jgi:type 1 glutamine amidotransferase
MARRASGFSRFFRTLMLLAAVLAALILGYAYVSGAWHLLFPSSSHDTRQPYLAPDLRSPAVLVFSKTNQLRHIDGIAGGVHALEQIAIGRGWTTFFTENGAVFNAQQLASFDAVVFLNATGDMLSNNQQAAFESWLENGGGWLGIHAAGDGSHQGWPWYMKNLIGANFTAHIMGPQIQIASVVTENHQHPAVQAIPNVWNHADEWYSWDLSPRAAGFTILAALDEDSYTPVQSFPWGDRDLRMSDHPVVWSNCVADGRAVYTALGHTAESFKQPVMRKIMEDALAWVMSDSADDC